MVSRLAQVRRRLLPQAAGSFGGCPNWRIPHIFTSDTFDRIMCDGRICWTVDDDQTGFAPTSAARPHRPPPDGKPKAVTAAEKTVWRLTFVDFPWDINKALEFALLRTYAVPSISGLLARTGEFEQRTAKRYDDTALLIREVLRNGLDSDRARRSFARINGMHGRFRIAPEDFLYVLSTFVFSPIDWLEAYGRRPMSDAER